jgi:hypothetical protein
LATRIVEFVKKYCNLLVLSNYSIQMVNWKKKNIILMD